jgi:hypothetical protein
MPQVGPFGLQWQNYSSNAVDLIALVPLDFTTPSTTYTILPQGNFQQLGNLFAAGIVIDNLVNSNTLTVRVGAMVETVPPYSKTLITLPSSGGQVVASAAGGLATLMFFRGDFHGSSGGTNFYSAQQAANLATLSNGLVDAWLNSLQCNENWQLTAGTDLNLLLKTGFFDCVNPLNAPTGTGATIWHVEMQVYSQGPTYARQSAYTLDVAGFHFERWLISGAWSAWIQIPSTAYNNPENTLRILEYQDMAGVSSLVVDVSGWAVIAAMGTLAHATAGQGVAFQVSNNGGVSWGTGSDYLWAGMLVSTAAASLAQSSNTAQASMPLAGNVDAGSKQAFDLRCMFPTTGQNMSAFATKQWVAGGQVFNHNITGYRSLASNVDHIRFFCSAGAFTSGQIVVWGVA